jgi:hypothetical protein
VEATAILSGRFYFWRLFSMGELKIAPSIFGKDRDLGSDRGCRLGAGSIAVGLRLRSFASLRMTRLLNGGWCGKKRFVGYVLRSGKMGRSGAAPVHRPAVDRMGRHYF